MIGSANLTAAGMMTNREVAITIVSSDEIFDELPTLFDELWQSASVLTDDALQRFKTWHRSNANTRPAEHVDGLEPSSPTTVNIATRTKTRERTYLESFRREYYETLIPSYREVQEVYLSTGSRHAAFESLPIEYEIDRFLNWAKLTFTTDETLHTFPIRKKDDGRSQIQHHIEKWLVVQLTRFAASQSPR